MKLRLATVQTEADLRLWEATESANETLAQLRDYDAPNTHDSEGIARELDISDMEEALWRKAHAGDNDDEPA